MRDGVDGQRKRIARQASGNIFDTKVVQKKNSFVPQFLIVFFEIPLALTGKKDFPRVRDIGRNFLSMITDFIKFILGPTSFVRDL